jgi:hypothetical protein
MDIGHREIGSGSVGDAFLMRTSDATRGAEDPDGDDLYPEDVTGVLLGFAGVLVLIVLLAVLASLSVVAALIQRL